jgi:ArsR family transcriptional regulator
MELSKFAKAFKALSNEKRLEIFHKIYEWGKLDLTEPEEMPCCCAPVEKSFSKVAECIKLSRSTISHHMKELENAGLILCRKEGQSHFCKVNSELLEELRKFLA